MSLEMTIKQFEELNLFSNKNVEKIATSIINETSNAALVGMYEDSVILLDHEEGQFYKADYDFDAKTLTLALENFEEIDLIKEKEGFSESVKNFFEDEISSTSGIVESYKSNVLTQEKIINEIILESLSHKDFEDLIDYSELHDLNKNSNIKSATFFENYSDRIKTNPMTSAKFLNFKDKISISLLENETVKLVNKSKTEKANDLWKLQGFKSGFVDAAKVFIEDVDEGQDLFFDLFEEYPSVFFLDKSDRKTLFGKTIISDKFLRESLTDLQKGLNLILEDEKFIMLKEQYVNETEDLLNEDTSGDTDLPYELNQEEYALLMNEVKTLSENVNDEKLKLYLSELYEELDENANEGTRVDLIKEAVSLFLI